MRPCAFLFHSPNASSFFTPLQMGMSVAATHMAHSAKEGASSCETCKREGQEGITGYRLHMSEVKGEGSDGAGGQVGRRAAR